MKHIHMLILASALLQPALPVWAEAVAANQQEEAREDWEEAARALAYRAQLARDITQRLALSSPSASLTKASRLALQIRSQALELAQNIAEYGDADWVIDQLEHLEGLVLQFEAAKREILRLHRTDRELTQTLNNVRRTYYYLKEQLTGDI